MKKGIYIEALKLGVENLDEGISYANLIEYLSKMGYVIDGNYKGYFHCWFFCNYYHQNRTPAAKFTLDVKRQNIKEWIEPHNADKHKCILMAEGYMQYMEWVELKDARKTAKRSMIVAIIAISISALLAYLSLASQINWFPFCN